MEKPNIKDYQYSDGEMRDLVAYTEALEKYIEHLETKDKNLTISDVVNCSNCNSTKVVRENIYRCEECNCFHGKDGQQL